MLPGDIVRFNIAIDRRDGTRRATNVRLHKLIEDQKERSGREKVCVCVRWRVCVLGGVIGVCVVEDQVE